jgi:hypothetical protein
MAAQFETVGHVAAGAGLEGGTVVTGVHRARKILGAAQMRTAPRVDTHRTVIRVIYKRIQS